jgi:hypothetical protein
MNIKDMKGTTLKKLMNAERSSFRWHNKNKRGGNFGIEIRGIEGKNFEISADYNILGNFFHLRFGPIYHAGMRLNLGQIETIEELCVRLKKIIEIMKNMDKRFHEMEDVA